jgi:hypothetical protein
MRNPGKRQRFQSTSKTSADTEIKWGLVWGSGVAGVDGYLLGKGNGRCHIWKTLRQECKASKRTEENELNLDNTEDEKFSLASDCKVLDTAC